jgi:hypothetical protein
VQYEIKTLSGSWSAARLAAIPTPIAVSAIDITSKVQFETEYSFA